MTPTGFTLRQVIVEQIVPKRGLLICKEISSKHKMEVPMLPMRVRAPRVGEHWLLDQVYGFWSFAALLRATDTAPEVTGPRAGADPVTLSLLAALVEVGLVRDKTV